MDAQPNTKADQLKRAAELGAKARVEGKGCFPASDVELQAMVAGRVGDEVPPGEAHIAELWRAWAAAYENTPLPAKALEQLAWAKELGAKAHAAGRTNRADEDVELNALLDARGPITRTPAGEASAHALIDAWIRGWLDAEHGEHNPRRIRRRK